MRTPKKGKTMKNLLKLEQIAFFALGIFLFSQIGYSWWWFLGLFFVPDVSILGYLLNPKIGAFVYNIFHHYAVAVGLYFIGMYFQITEFQMIGSIFFAHSAFDRMLGFGLKYSDDFKNTHLGRIGK